MFWTVIPWLFRLIGLAEWFESWNAARIARKKQQSIPLTNAEENDEIDNLPSR